MKHWVTGWACNLNDLFVRFPYKSYKFLNKFWKDRKKQKTIVKQVFRESIRLILEDIIENNVTFKIQGIGCLGGEMHMEAVLYEDFETQRKRGKFKNIDFLETNFTGYLLYLYIHGKRDNFLHRRKFPVYFNKDLLKKLAKYVNSGKTYC